MRRRIIAIAGALGALGAVAIAIGLVIAPVDAAFAYLTAWAFALSIAVGALIFAMIGVATGARWPNAFRRITGAIAATLPALAVLFVPIALVADRLYPWIDPSPALDAESRARLAHKAPYLNLPFWTIRAAGFLVVWIAIAELLARFTARGDARARVIATAGLPAVGLTLTFAAFDWLMSLTPLWSSTLFGLVYFAGGFVAALALIAVIARLAPARVGPAETGALGRLVFAFVVFWAYLEFSQGFLIWIADKPDEVPWYVARGAGGWGAILVALAIGHFALPFAGLLARAAKRQPTVLALAGALIVVMHYVDLAWLILPVLRPSPALHWTDLAAPCAVLGLAVAFAAARTRADV